MSTVAAGDTKPRVVDKTPQQIRSMFARVSPRYDLANRILSLRSDVYWRRRVTRSLLDMPGLVLDLASGTGDLAMDLSRRGQHRVVAADFTFEMLAEGKKKMSGLSLQSRQVGADALSLPFRHDTFDGVTVAFGIRNFADPTAGLREIRRVLRSGGRAGILEFSMPRPPFRWIYTLYFRHVLPLIGGAVTGSRSAFDYLPASVQQFPQGRQFLELMQQAGFTKLTADRLTLGIATFYRGEK